MITNVKLLCKSAIIIQNTRAEWASITDGTKLKKTLEEFNKYLFGGGITEGARSLASYMERFIDTEIPLEL